MVVNDIKSTFWRRVAFVAVAPISIVCQMAVEVWASIGYVLIDFAEVARDVWKDRR